MKTKKIFKKIFLVMMIVLLFSCEDSDNLTGISLSFNGTHTFLNTTEGYDIPSPFSVTVINHGSSGITVSVTLTGQNAEDFSINYHYISINLRLDRQGGDTSRREFTVTPRSGLTVGTYTAIIIATVDGQHSDGETFNVTFTVTE